MKFKTIKNRFDAMEPYVRGKAVLDIGCVDARPGGVRKYRMTGLHLFLKERASSLVGVDVDEEGVRQMKSEGLDVVAADCERMDLQRRFDCIVAGEVIEHLSNPGLFLDNMRGHLVDRGVLVITTSNAFAIGNFYRILRTSRIKVHGEHTCWYDPVTLTQLLSRHRFMVEGLFFSNKRKWYERKNLLKLKYQVPRFFSRLRPYFSGTIIAAARKA
ncbi:MAG: class I SAM-dependent methyltransferase [Deltaproteobacteria bacterium]|nr:class I SAM-dependent methyltransferase [Deltaproteobacteria bacterium]